ncbi:MAG: SulP family sulfate permease [Candidatus Azotimanducaceae bacterium]|jgi:SulP family sulfate permease
MLGSSLLEAFRSGQLFRSYRQNIVAGLTVGIVALPLSMGLSIAVGLPPQHGLYTAIVGGIVITLLGGSPVNISGPTAAFVVILAPIVQQYGLGGLLVSGFLAGLILVAMGALKIGKFIQTVPYPVVIGFTAGIGTVIAVLQVKDLIGLAPAEAGTHFFEKLQSYLGALDTFQWQEAFVGLSTLAVIFFWKRISSRVPSYLVALFWGTALASICNVVQGIPDVETISSRFSYSIGDLIGQGIPPFAPSFALPWNLITADGSSTGFSFELLQTFFGAAFTIAVLGALESLLCAVVADGMTGKQHDPDAELIGQGLGNMVVPFFGGIPATAAIARTALNVRTGGTTPVSAVVHSLFLLAAILFLAPLLSYIPMAAMAAILVAVAWNMSEVSHVIHLIKTAPKPDISVFIVCYGLTVVIDMQVAVAAGMVMAAAFFLRRMSELTSTTVLAEHEKHPHIATKEGIVVYDVDGPLFFGAAHKALRVVTALDKTIHSVVLDISGVPMVDTTAMVNIRSLASSLKQSGIKLYLLSPQPHIRTKLQRFKLGTAPNNIVITDDPFEID